MSYRNHARDTFFHGRYRCHKFLRVAIVAGGMLCGSLGMAGCILQDTPSNDANDACAVFGRLMVKREQSVVSADELNDELDTAIDEAELAARDEKWVKLRDNLKILRESTSTLDRYGRVESDVYQICTPFIGT